MRFFFRFLAVLSMMVSVITPMAVSAQEDVPECTIAVDNSFLFTSRDVSLISAEIRPYIGTWEAPTSVGNVLIVVPGKGPQLSLFLGDGTKLNGEIYNDLAIVGESIFPFNKDASSATQAPLHRCSPEGMIYDDCWDKNLCLWYAEKNSLN